MDPVEHIRKLIAEAAEEGDHEFIAVAQQQIEGIRSPQTIQDLWERAQRIVAEQNGHHSKETK